MFKYLSDKKEINNEVCNSWEFYEEYNSESEGEVSRMDTELQESQQRDQIERIPKVIKDTNEDRELRVFNKLHTFNLTQEFHLRSLEDKTEIIDTHMTNAQIQQKS